MGDVTDDVVQLLSGNEIVRAERVLRKLARHDIGNWALTGGLAFEIHGKRLGLDCSRPLNDIDFIAVAFTSIPETLSQDFLFRHIHPAAPPGKTILQLIDPDAALRVDVFRACGQTMQRVITLAQLRIASLEDLVARTARLLLDLAEGVPVAPKHARDYQRFAELAGAEEMEAAWRDHRKPLHPTTFQATKCLLQDLIPASGHLLIAPEYSRDPNEAYSRCAPTGAFQLADPKLVLSLLGYC
jgi:hypothetical protein